ncbi:uncharacterized protein BXIN_0814 [Babesia sp. Xinjiang]|uniref:uncharacterized protein n=1 Tax=Babesia sp. Xinjiang TaxID=462227 RepID=UPI000A243203|nr:uncharacterized protein BXIN_0814 [Babesia sp. Xinjiang]ORM41310.1 hypothetical protein BXIN_0814 [Babesia sp. Xinjiang]
MERLEASAEPNNGTVVSQELSFHNLDIERLFVDTDEITVLKTLQNMHLANYKLEDEIKGIMTNGIEPITLYSGTMLGMCNLVRETQTGLNELARHCRNFEIAKAEEYESDPDVSNDTEIKEVVDRYSLLHYNDTSVSSLCQGKERSDYVTVLLKSVDILQRVSMENFRLLKGGKLLKSYQLLKIRSPALMTLVTHLIERSEVPAKLRAVDASPPISETTNDHQDVLSGSKHVLESITPEHFQEVMKDLPVVLRYNIAKLLRTCDVAFGSSKLGLLVEASICLLMSNEHYYQDANRLWIKRVKAANAENSRLVVGCLSSSEEILLQLLTSTMYGMFCRNVNQNSMINLKRIVGVDIPDDISDAPFAEIETCSEQKYWTKSFDLLHRNFERIELDDIIEFTSRLKATVVESRKSMANNALLSQVFGALGIEFPRALVKASSEILEHLERTYIQSAQVVAMAAASIIERRMCARELCTFQIKELEKFVSQAACVILSQVNDRMTQVLMRVREEVRSLDKPISEGGILGTYSEEGSVSRWLHTTGVGNLVLNAESLWPQLEDESSALLDEVASKCVLPSEGKDRVVLTLIGTAALGSQYTLLGSRRFSNRLKIAVLEYWISLSHELDEREKSLLVLCFKDSGLAQGAKTLGDVCETLATELGEERIEAYKSEYEAKQVVRKRDDYCQMKPLRDCLIQNGDDITQCIKEVELFERTCDSNKPYFHSKDGLDDSRSGLYSGKRHL